MASAPSLALLDLVVRFSAFGILLLAAALLLRDAAGSWAGRLCAAFTITVAAYLLCSSSEIRAALGPLHLAILAFCLAGPAMLWLTALALFEDDFEPGVRHFLPLALLEISGYARALLPLEATTAALLSIAHELAIVALFGHALYIAWHGRLDDLVEARRELRRVFIGVVCVIGVAIAVVELWVGTGTAPQVLEFAAAATILLTAVALLFQILKVDQGWLALSPSRSAAPAMQRRPSLVDRPADPATLVSIERAFAADRIYRREGLTISSLAAHLKVPEHQLRRVINQALGFRNFSAFLNHHRIADVKRALASTERARVPVLTIALEAGYASLAPFNRAFRESEGITPTEYRRQELASRTQDEGSAPVDSENL